MFHKWRLLPWYKTTKGIALVLGIIILTVFLVGLQGLTPASTQATITGPITEIAPQVSGRVVEVPVQANVELLPNDVRQAVGSWLGQRGFSEAQIGALLGHAAATMTGRYVHFQADSLRAMVDALDGILDGRLFGHLETPPAVSH